MGWSSFKMDSVSETGPREILSRKWINVVKLGMIEYLILFLLAFTRDTDIEIQNQIILQSGSWGCFANFYLFLLEAY